MAPPRVPTDDLTTEPIQLLDPDGNRHHHPDYDVDLTDDEYRGLYRDMAIIRRLDAEGTALQRQGQLGLWASLLGQEAAQVGAGRALRDNDVAFPTYREHGVLYCRGMDPVRPFALFRGVNQGGWGVSDHGMQTYTIVIGAQTLHAVGYALGVAMDGAVGNENDDDTAVMAFLGDGAMSQGDVSEAFIWASVSSAPVVFFCQNNQYAISEPTSKQTRIPLYQRARGFGFPGVRVDGNDVLASLAVARAALDVARGGDGPMFVEAFTYRMGAHTTSDDPTRYRVPAEVQEWQARDPITRYRTYLEKSGLADEDFFTEVGAEADQLAGEVRATVLALPDPEPLSIFDDVYPAGSAHLDSQRAKYAEYLAGFEGAEVAR